MTAKNVYGINILSYSSTILNYFFVSEKTAYGGVIFFFFDILSTVISIDGLDENESCSVFLSTL